MANVSVNSASGIDFDFLDADTFDLSGITDFSASSTRVRVTFDDNTSDVFDGFGITTVGDEVTGGTVTRIRNFDGARLVFDITNISIAATTIQDFFDINDGLGLADLVLNGADTIQSGGGDDVLTGLLGDDVINGGDGDDLLIDAFGDNQLNGGSGTDVAFYLDSISQFFVNVVGDAIEVSARSGGATNTINRDIESIVFSDETILTESLFADVPVPPDLGTPSIIGTDASERLTGSAGVDVVNAGGGDDIVKTSNGDDDIDLGAGDDIVLSGSGDDIVRGGDGNDVIKTGAGDDHIDGGAGDDFIISGDGDDIILGGDDPDVIKPGRGDDRIDGGGGDDIILGFTQNEFMLGGDGDDRLGGNLGDDTLIGGPGDDRLFGGPGRDNFLYPNADFGNDRIVLDFRPTSDTINFQGSGLTLDDLNLKSISGKVIIDIIGVDSSIVIAADRIGPLTVASVEDALLF